MTDRARRLTRPAGSGLPVGCRGWSGVPAAHRGAGRQLGRPAGDGGPVRSPLGDLGGQQVGQLLEPIQGLVVRGGPAAVLGRHRPRDTGGAGCWSRCGARAPARCHASTASTNQLPRHAPGRATTTSALRTDGRLGGRCRLIICAVPGRREAAGPTLRPSAELSNTPASRQWIFGEITGRPWGFREPTSTHELSRRGGSSAPIATGGRRRCAELTPPGAGHPPQPRERVAA
jgi:hypothetical protein